MEAEVTASAAKAAGTQNPAAIKTAINLKGDDMLILPVPTLIGAGAYSGSLPGTARKSTKRVNSIVSCRSPIRIGSFPMPVASPFLWTV